LGYLIFDFHETQNNKKGIGFLWLSWVTRLFETTQGGRARANSCPFGGAKEVAALARFGRAEGSLECLELEKNQRKKDRENQGVKMMRQGNRHHFP